MELDIWTHTKVPARAGTNSYFGSPRSWFGRAYDMKFQNDYPSMKSDTTIDFREVTLGAIFHRPCKLPNFGNQRVLYRFFQVPRGYMGSGGYGHKRDYQELIPVIGVALAVPVDQVLEWHQTLEQDSEAQWLWSSVPIRVPETTQSNEYRSNNQYDYEVIYKLLDEGMAVREIARRIDGQAPAISYIKKRWERGLPPKKKVVVRKVKLNHDAILADIDSGMSVLEVSLKHEATKTTIYTIVKKYRT